MLLYVKLCCDSHLLWTLFNIELILIWGKIEQGKSGLVVININ